VEDGEQQRAAVEDGEQQRAVAESGNQRTALMEYDSSSSSDEDIPDAEDGAAGGVAGGDSDFTVVTRRGGGKIKGGLGKRGDAEPAEGKAKLLKTGGDASKVKARSKTRTLNPALLEDGAGASISSA
jgi:hypothetical protein